MTEAQFFFGSLAGACIAALHYLRTSNPQRLRNVQWVLAAVCSCVLGWALGWPAALPVAATLASINGLMAYLQTGGRLQGRGTRTARYEDLCEIGQRNGVSSAVVESILRVAAARGVQA